MNSHIDIHRSLNRDAVAGEASNFLQTLFHQYDKESLLFLTSGGSALNVLQDTSLPVFTSGFAIGVVDERFSQDETINNYLQLSTTTFFQNATAAGATTLNTVPRSTDTPQTLAARWEASLRSWRQNNKNGHLITLLGIGPDGHTAGIMPYPEDSAFFTNAFDNPAHWITSYDAKEKSQYPLRVTATFPLLRLVDHALVYAVGEEKKKIVQTVLASSDETFRYPARIIHHMPQVDLFTDQSV